MQRQVWVFLNEADEKELLARLDKGVGLRRLPGRFVKGTVEDVHERPEQLETADLLTTERWTHLIHPTATRQIVLHPVTEGPFAGWSKLDEIRSEVVTLVRPLPDSAGLAPSQLRASTHAWFGAEKHRKSSEFTLWATELMRATEEFPSTAFDWIRVAPGASEWSKSGGMLHYLFRRVALEPEAGATIMHRPHASIRE